MIVVTEQKDRGARARRSAETRERILATAADLFYREGVRATGVDAVAAGAEVAPTTLYRLFASKDDLVAAYVDRCSAVYQQLLTTASAPSAGSPRDRILAVVDAFADEALSETCRGCPFQMVLAEFPDPDSAPHRRAVAHKAWLLELFRGLVAELGERCRLSDPDALAEQLVLVGEGIYSAAQSLGTSGPARHGRACAETLLELATDRRRTLDRVAGPVRRARRP